MKLIAPKIGLYHRFWTWLSRALRLWAYYGEPTKIVNKVRKSNIETRAGKTYTTER